MKELYKQRNVISKYEINCKLRKLEKTQYCGIPK